MIKINEIFYSVQGESSYSGWPTVFVRTSGCNLRCSYCDTKYSYYEGQSWAPESIIEKIQDYGARFVCITGGEPLLQPEIYPLMTALCDRNYKVSLETSGSKSCAQVDTRVKLVIDVKTPDSGAKGSFHPENLMFRSFENEFKFVICSETDWTWSDAFCRTHNLYEATQVLFSPSHGIIDPRWLAEKLLAAKVPARLQLQLHKYIWSPDKRGV